MGRKRKLIDKKIKKLLTKKCQICGLETTEILDYHRIIPGSKLGTYKKSNVAVICCNCHRSIHKGHIEVIGWKKTTAGNALHVIIDGEEDFIFDTL